MQGTLFKELPLFETILSVISVFFFPDKRPNRSLSLNEIFANCLTPQELSEVSSSIGTYLLINITFFLSFSFSYLLIDMVLYT